MKNVWIWWLANADYRLRHLNNPVNDTKAVAEALREAGFEVKTVFNLTKSKMGNLVFEFGEKLKLQKGIGLFMIQTTR